MVHRHWLLVLTVAASIFVAACGSQGGGGTSSSSSTSGSGGSSSTSGGTGGAACSGSPPTCVASCFNQSPVPAACTAGGWMCTGGSIDQSLCSANPCGTPAPCEAGCTDTGWECSPTAACLAACPAHACGPCPSEPAIHVGGCSCTCGGDYSCTPEACCTQTSDCGDAGPVACVNGICKKPAATGCWSGAECSAPDVCQGVVVCACGQSCLGADKPGTCTPPPP